jgi:heterotetrameric sarcosine oxidase delta subunit
MRLPCPFCGTRDDEEFVFGGPAHLERPAFESDDATWTAYLYLRDNPAGLQFERWHHLYGCGRWFNLARDTVTHEIHCAYRMGDPPPDLGTLP